MAKLELETKKIINEYYEIKIRYLKKEIDKREDFLDITIKNSFNNDKRVDKIKNMFEELENDYKEIDLRLCCEIYSYRSGDFNNDKEIIELKNQIADLKNERACLYMNLENNSKTSKVYKECLQDFMQKWEAERNGNSK